ncbi:MAG TPA: HAD family hydrolase [Polyangiaceae bacterium]|jgi:HAD superfamily hydrolase (TIGR01509 family)|nr:HAD family hydrolase [Polyangiaceae bacterium]
MNVDRRQITTLVFDVDGTLYRQSGLRRAMLLKLLVHAVQNIGSSFATFRILREYRRAQEVLRETHVDGDLTAAQMRIACQRSGYSDAIVSQTVTRWMEHEPAPLLERFMDPGLRSFLTAAKGRRLRMGVLSDYPAADKLAAMKLSEFFEVVVSAQDAAVNRFKPHPSGLLEVLRRLGATPPQALYIGDRHDVDAAVARAAGVHCVILGRRGEATAAEGFTAVANYERLEKLLFAPDGADGPGAPTAA